MYLKAASLLLLLLPLLCFGSTAQETSIKRQHGWQHRFERRLTREVKRNTADNWKQATPRTEIRLNYGGNLDKATLTSERRTNAGKLERDMMASEARLTNVGGFEQDILRTKKGTHSRLTRSPNREKRSASWEGRRGFSCGWWSDIHIPTRWVCDGEIDCPMDLIYYTYKDEDYCFDCGNGQVIEDDWVCDDKTDCTNGFDEADCFYCGERGANSGRKYIRYSNVCDGGIDCADASDEDCFDCRDGNHIPYIRVCDKTIHCANGQDEDGCFACENGEAVHFSRVCKGDTECTNGLDEKDCFHCGRGKVIHPDRVCDGFTDCKNGFDENGCQFIACRGNETEKDCLNATGLNEDHYFRCNSGHWTFMVYRCDRIPDCDDHSDEQNCYVTPCPDNHFKCPDGRCKGRVYFCEYVFNEYIKSRDRSNHRCDRQDDIYNCYNYTCFDTVNTFQCTSGECKKASRRCNTVHNCPDGSDELACENHTCSAPGEFQCDSGHCVSPNCYADQRCPDNSDEALCAPNVHGCDVDAQCADGSCIDILDWCNHTPDCHDGSDEKFCENYTCDFFHFRCNSGQCIDNEKQCDNQADCVDGSDEVNCEFKCSLDHLRCDTGNCYPIHKRCDGNQDCIDQSDENNCVNGTLCPRFTHTPCLIKSSQCVPSVYFCDGIIDCSDTSDEYNCHDPTCSNKNSYKCSNGRCVSLTGMCEAFIMFQESAIMLLLQDSTRVTHCHDEPDNHTCKSYQCSNKKYHFRCNTGYCIPVQKRCNLIEDCPDGSDEDYCGESQCDSQMFNCSNGLCIARSRVCDRIVDCSDGGDERKCYFQCPDYHCETGHCIAWDNGLCNGYFEVDDLAPDGTITTCPVFHDDEKYCPFIKCPIDYQRKPTGGCEQIKEQTNRNCSTSETADDCTDKCRNELYYVQCCNCSCVHRVSICDGIDDCPNGTDERNCGRVECRPDQFYCSNITCFPVEFRCDGYPHCPHDHDEHKCELNVTQQSMAKVVATQTDHTQECFDPSICFTAAQICKSSARCNMEIDNTDCFLLCTSPCVCQPSGQMFCRQRVGNNNPSVKDHSKMLWPFNSSSRIYTRNNDRIRPVFFTFETVSVISITNASLKQVPTRLLTCAFNIQHLNLSHNAITHISVGDFGRLYLLVLLDLSNNLIASIEDFSFKGIRVLDVRFDDNDISDFGIDLFSGMAVDRTLTTDDYRFCCIRPPHLPEYNCFPGPNQFSSCKDLMKNTVLSTLVWIVGFITLFGNVGVILLMITIEKESLGKNHGVMITNLAVADALMAVCLLSIGSVDAMYRDIYITKDYEWRNSVWCSLVGVICMISIEASVFFICLITVDRYLIVKYPFGQVRLSRSNIIVISLCIWLISIAIAVIPVAITPYFKGAFYSKSGVCIALPLTTESFDGWEYSFAISVCLNFIMLLIVGVGQFLIVREIVLAGRNSLVSTRRRNDFTIAVKLTFVVLSDVCCWVPIGVLGIMALAGFQIHPDTYAWVVVFVLPINSALNPFWYTLISQLTKYLKKRKSSTLEKDRVVQAL